MKVDRETWEIMRLWKMRPMKKKYRELQKDKKKIEEIRRKFKNGK